MMFPRPCHLLLLLILLASPLQAQSYAELAQKATLLLEEHKRDKANGVTTPWSEKDKAYQAGDLWLEAAKLAGSDAERFRAYEAAGQAYAVAQTLGDEALKAFVLARDVAGVSGQQRAEAGVMAARRGRTRADWEAVVAIPGAPAQQLATAYHEIALTYIVPAKTDPALNQQVAEFYEKAAQQMAKYDARAADTELGMAQSTIADAPPSPAVLAVLDRLVKAEQALPLGDDKPLRQALIELDWARNLARLKANDRAVATWQAVGKNTAYPVDQRVEGWTKAAEVLRAQGKLDPALAALDAAAKLRADNYIYSEKIAQLKLAILDPAKRNAEALAVVRGLAKHPGAASKRELLALDEARYLYRLGKTAEGDALLAPFWTTPPRAGVSIYEIAVLKAEEAVVKDPARARKEVDAGLGRLLEMSDRNVGAMQLISARLYAHQKDYASALKDYTACARQGSGLVVPNNDVLDGVRSMFSQALKEKKTADAEAIVAAVKTWQVDAIAVPLMQAELFAATGNAQAARAAVASCRTELQRFYGPNKEALEKEIARIEATIR